MRGARKARRVHVRHLSPNRKNGQLEENDGFPEQCHLGRDSEGGATYRLAGEIGATFPPDRTVLLVIDPVNDFLSEEGAG
jgi:hypothetical protein